MAPVYRRGSSARLDCLCIARKLDHRKEENAAYILNVSAFLVYIAGNIADCWLNYVGSSQVTGLGVHGLVYEW